MTDTVFAGPETTPTQKLQPSEESPPVVVKNGELMHYIPHYSVLYMYMHTYIVHIHIHVHVHVHLRTAQLKVLPLYRLVQCIDVHVQWTCTYICTHIFRLHR